MIGMFDGMWGFTLFSNTTLHEAFLNGLAKLEQTALSKLEQTAIAAAPYAGRLLGITFGVLYPSEISKDDPRMMATAHIVSTLPADKVTNTPVSSLPTQQATAVHTRIADVVAEDGKQHLAIVRDTDRLGSVPVVEAKATQRAGVYTASVVPGKPDVHIKIAAGTAPAVSQQKSVQKEQGGSRFPGFTAGQQSHDAIVRFPGNKTSPIYISITEVLPESEIRKQQEEEERRQQEWDARHPVEVAVRHYQEAIQTVIRAQENVNQQRATLQNLQQTVEGLLLSDPSRYPISYQKKETAWIKSALRSYILTLGPFEIKNSIDLDKLLYKGAAVFDPIPQGVDPAQTSGDGYDVAQAIRRLTIAEYEALRTRIISRQQQISAAQTALNSALESLKQEEQKEKDAGNKVEEEKEKNKGKVPDLKIEEKVKRQMPDRDWTEQDLMDTVAKGGKGKTVDQRKPKNTDDGLGRNDPATVYGEPGKYVVVNDRTGEVTQISDKTDVNWVDDSRIQWED